MSEKTRMAILLGIAMLVYGNTLWNQFAFDDEAYIFRNHAVTNPSLRSFFTVQKSTNVFRPVSFASFALDWKIAGGKPIAFHAMNLLLHAAVTLLLYLILRKLLEPVSYGAKIAFAAALLFAVHPIHTEAVAWASGRSELLATALVLAAWLLHLEDWPFLALLCFALGLLSKESAVEFLPLVLAGDYLRGKFKPAFTYVTYLGVALSYISLLWVVQGRRFGEVGMNFADNPLYTLPAVWRILNALRIAWKYIALQIYPATLSCDYSYNAILLYMKWRPMLPALLATLAVIILWFWALWKRKTVWALAGAIYLVGFAITANLLLPIGTIMGERLAYLPSAGFCLLLAAVWIALERRRREFAWALLVLLALALGTRTWVRNRDWHDNLTLFSAAVRAVPGSTKMHGNLGGAYMYTGRLEDARKELELALRIYPDIPENLAFYGLVESRLGNDDEALKQMRKAVAIATRSSLNYDFMVVNLATQLMKMGKDDEAMHVLDEEVAASPDYARAWSNRAVIWYRHGEMTPARTDAQAALRLDPANAQARELLSALNNAASKPAT
jgi:tetratricopeptide (TPR) repeat protein